MLAFHMVFLLSFTYPVMMDAVKLVDLKIKSLNACLSVN